MFLDHFFIGEISRNEFIIKFIRICEKVFSGNGWPDYF
jgi:hypothetical protein